jgi:hypothetical protein
MKLYWTGLPEGNRTLRNLNSSNGSVNKSSIPLMFVKNVISVFNLLFCARTHVRIVCIFNYKRDETCHLIFRAKDDLERHAQYIQLSGSGKCDNYRKLASALFGVTTHSRFARSCTLVGELLCLWGQDMKYKCR